MKKTVLIRFGDLSLKGRNKGEFIKQVQFLLKSKLNNFDVHYTFQHDRILIEVKGEHLDQILKQLTYVSGISSYSIIYPCKKDIDAISEMALAVVQNEIKGPTTFKVETKRADKKFPLTSQEISRKVASYILPKVPGLSVDVKRPHLLLNVEVRETESFVYVKKIPGLGGFPIGIGGKALLMLSGGIDSPVAGYLMMKQGIEIELFHFESTPLTPLESVQKVIDIAKKLALFMPNNEIKLHLLPFTPIHEEILKHVDDPYIITIMRRSMYEIAEKYALNHQLLGLVNGESVGQVASQTLESIMVVENVTRLPILRPVITYDKNDIISLAQKIDTFDISIRPFQDCCSIYVPKSPVTHPKLKRCEREESKLNVSNFIVEALENIETLVITPDTDFEISLYGFDVKEAIKHYRSEKND